MSKITLQGKLIVVHGPPGIGKTQLASKFPGPHKWFATEPGHSYIPKDQQKTLLSLPPGAESWEDFINESKEIGIGRVKYKTVVLDTIGGIFDCCMAWVCKKHGWEHPSDGAHGKGWDTLKREFYRGMAQLSWACSKTKATMIFICHSKEVEIETRTSTTTKIQLDLTGTARKVIVPIPDHIWFMGYADLDPSLDSDSHKRALFLDGTPGIEAKCRDDRVKRKRIRPLSKSKPYQQILSLLNKDIDS